MYRLAVDLGGTNIAAAVVDEKYNIVSRANVKTPKGSGLDALADALAEAVFAVLAAASLTKENISFAGIGVPGSVDSKNGIVYFAPNLSLKNAPLRAVLFEKTGIMFALENDANAAALGEMLAGCGKGANSLVMVTLGTGVGGGIVINKKIYSGVNSVGAELGHMVIKSGGEKCGCGQKGCFEAYASVSALIRESKNAARQYPDSKINDICKGNLESIDGKTAFEAARLNDPAAKAVLENYFDNISVGITNLINIFQPQILCIGGSISKEGERLIAPIRERIEKYDFAKNLSTRTKLVAAELYGDAGLIGAAFSE